MKRKYNYGFLIEHMTLEEKASLMSGADFWHTKAVDRLGIPQAMMTDGQEGRRGRGYRLGAHRARYVLPHGLGPCEHVG